MKMVPFNKPPYIGTELRYLEECIKLNKFSGDGDFTKKCNAWLENKMACRKALLTTSCTHALELAAFMVGIQPGDEVIMPSYTFVSTANAFVIRGAKIVFVDIYPNTMNINEELIKQAITSRTKAIVPVHYAGISCNMDEIMSIATKYNLYVIEDAAQAVMSTYKKRSLGTIGHMGAYSFHETKNISCGEGGALIINEDRFIERAEILREKGTNRSKYFRGQIDKYTWVDIGSSYLPSELNAAFLLAQLEKAKYIINDRLNSWNRYYELLQPLQKKGLIELPVVSEDCCHNAHMFYIKCNNLEERYSVIGYLNNHGIQATFHYIPLHSSPAGKKFGEFYGEDINTTRESERLLRLPMFYKLSEADLEFVCKRVKQFYLK